MNASFAALRAQLAAVMACASLRNKSLSAECKLVDSSLWDLAAEARRDTERAIERATEVRI